MTTDKRKEAMSMYVAPFKYLHGYVFDARNQMVSDNGNDSDANSVEGSVAARVRGWGRFSYFENGAEVQDEVGQMMADALNDYYEKVKQNV